MDFYCQNPGCTNSESILDKIGDAAIEKLEDDYGWGWRNRLFLCHTCLDHDD